MERSVKREADRLFGGLRGLGGHHAHIGSVVLLGDELHGAMSGREQGVVLADADILARPVLRAALANEDVAGEHGFAAELLDAEALARGQEAAEAKWASRAERKAAKA